MPSIQSTTQLAKHLGLSRWTVSRALNHHPSVHPQTADRVLRAVRELGFSPDPMARVLRGGRSGTIGICVQELQNLNLTTKISALQQNLRLRQYRGLIEFTMGNPTIEEEVIRHFVAMRVEGVVLIASQQTLQSEGYQLLKKNQIPTIFIDPLHARLPGTIQVNRSHAMALLVDHLHQLGHRQFATLGISPSIEYGEVRAESIVSALNQHDLKADEHLRMFAEPHNDFIFEYGDLLARKLLQSQWRATAIIALSDRIAIGAIHRLQQNGISVPEDVSIVGYDNMDITAYCHPTLTTVDANVDELISKATDHLFDQIANQVKPCKSPIVIQPKLIIRQSTAKVG